MSEVREWLEDLGLGQYADAFEAEQIDLDAARYLTDDVLKDLGVPTGPRLKLLASLKTLGTTRPLDAPSPDRAELTETSTTAPEAERRQITVMFCDLVGSAALSERLDPEDLRTLMQAYQQGAGAVIERYEGHVAQYLGDGLMTYFGWPKAHEDDAERAIRAALEITEATKSVEAPEPLQVHVGIATGPVVVGETGAGDASVPKLAVGDTPILAARLQGLAEADEIVIADSSHRLTAGAFHYDDLGEKALKGIVEPVRAWRVTGIARTEGRFEAAHGVHFTPLVGREEEIALLMRRWQMARDGEGQIVLLCGEPGIGKSRITQELRQRVARQKHTRVRYQCSPYHTNSALYPLIEQFERAAGFTRDDTAEVKLDKMESLLGQSAEDVATVAPLIAAMLSIDTGARYPALNLSPQKQKDLTLEVLAGQVLGLAAKQPVLIIVEDVHWIDPTTQEVFDLIVPTVGSARVLAVFTYRPEYQPSWTGYGHVIPIKLTPLGRTAATAMVEKVIGGRALPDKVLDQIVAKTDGVPLFVEELTKTVLESGPATDMEIPATLQDSLMARLDRLAPIREVAQIGACIGRKFDHELIAAVSPLGENALQDALQQLVNSELIFRTGAPPTAAYTFKHALVQDAAYESLLKSKRVQVHHLIAETLEAMFPDTCQNRPERLAQHLEAAERHEQATHYWSQAVSMALRKSTYAEAAAYIDSGLDCLPNIDNQRTRDEFELSLRFLEGLFGRRTIGYASERAGRAYERAEELMERIGAAGTGRDVLVGAGLYHWTQGRLPRAKRDFKRLLDISKETDDRSAGIMGRLYVGALEYLTGDAVGGLELVRQSYEEQGGEAGAYLEARDLRMATVAWLANINAFAGYPDQAFRGINESIEWSANLKHPFSATMAYGMAALTAAVLRDADGMLKWGGECMRLCEQHELPFWAGYARGARGLGLSQTGAPDEGVRELQNAIEMLEATGAVNGTPELGGYFAEAHLRAGDAEKAVELCDNYQTMIHDQEQFHLLPKNLVIKGKALLALPKSSRDAAEQVLGEAMKIALSQGGKTIELRAATLLARLWCDKGKRDQARDLLGPLFDWFTEGFDSADLTEAEALLKDLQ